MLSALLFCSAMLDDPQPPAVELKSRIVAASIFKPGIAMIVREMKIPSGKGRYKLDALPDILEGSFWYDASDGAKVGDVQTRLRFGEKKVTSKAESIGDYLVASPGKHVKLSVLTSKGETEEVEGTIGGIGGNQITLKLANGHLRSIQIGSVVDLDPTGLNATMEKTIPTVNEEIDFEVTAQKASTLRMLTLENGAAWESSYLVDLGPTQASITGKAQIVVGGLKFENTEVQALAGLPSLPDKPKFDLASGFGSMVAWLRGTQESYRAMRAGPRDPYTLIQSVIQEAQNRNRDISFYSAAPMGYGGFGGGQGAFVAPVGVADFDAQYNNNYNSQESGQNPPADALSRLEDLYSYPLGKVSMEPGDRLTRMLLEDRAAYERLYRWEITQYRRQPYEQPTERSRVVKLLRLKNRGKLPWTGGKAMVLKDSSPLAQTEMPFTAAGQDASLELGEVQDIPVTRVSKEIKREQVSLLRTYYNAVTVETTLAVENPRNEAFTIEIRNDVSGEVLAAEGAEITTLGTALNSLNKNSRVTWTVTLKPGEKRQFTVTTKTLV